MRTTILAFLFLLFCVAAPADTNTLTDRATGETITSSFFNDIHDALSGTFVGRNSSGAATAGQPLGSSAVPWGAFFGQQGSDVASASTIDLTAATGNVVDVTGTTTITAVTLCQGCVRLVRFTGALTLTHGASLVLPQAANITTEAGDYAEFVGYGSSVVRLSRYMKAGANYVEATETGEDAWAASSGDYGNATSIALTPGDWVITAFMQFRNSGASTITLLGVGISTDSTSNAMGDRVDGVNHLLMQMTSGNIAGTTGVMVPSYRVRVASTTTYYLKGRATWASGTMVTGGYRISAYRIPRL